MEDSDLVFYEENGQTKSLGYKVNNSLINRMPAMVMTGGGKGSKKGGPVPHMLCQQVCIYCMRKSNLRPIENNTVVLAKWVLSAMTSTSAFLLLQRLPPEEKKPAIKQEKNAERVREIRENGMGILFIKN